MERLYSEGKCKAIGVSNYTITHLEQMQEYCKVVPHINQFECHPLLVQTELRSWCAKHDIAVEAYTSLAGGELNGNKIVKTLSAKYKRTPAQILLKWGLQQNMVVIPKSIKKERILENSIPENFTMSDEDILALSELNSNTHVCWDPTEVA